MCIELCAPVLSIVYFFLRPVSKIEIYGAFMIKKRLANKQSEERKRTKMLDVIDKTVRNHQSHVRPTIVQ